MPWIPTTAILLALQHRLQGLRVDADDAQSPLLFQRVGLFGTARLAEALKSVFASEARVAFIVPGSESYDGGETDSLLIRRRRSTRLALLLADAAPGGGERAPGLVGGPTTVGILGLKERVIDNLMQHPFTTPAGLAFLPAEGEPLILEATTPGPPGRECWLQWLIAAAGSAKAPGSIALS